MDYATSSNPSNSRSHLEAELEGGHREEDESQMQYRRRRTATACKRCRIRKTRCNGARPVCIPCADLGVRCAYDTPSDAAKAKRFVFRKVVPLYDETDHHQWLSPTRNRQDIRLRKVEKALRQLMKQQPNSREVVDVDQARVEETGIVEDPVALPENRPSTKATFEESADSVTVISYRRTLGSRFFGPSSNIAFFKDVSKATTVALQGAGELRDTEEYLPQPPASQAAWPMPSETDIVSEPHIDSRVLPDRAQVLELVRLFFADTGMVFQFVHEATFVQQYERAEATKFRAVKRSWLCLLNVILAFASYVSARPDLSPRAKFSESNIFFLRARAILAEVDMRVEDVQMVQALLLMGHYLFGTHDPDDTWYLCGIAVRAAIQLGLHSSRLRRDLTLLENEVRERTWYACIITDRTLSVTFGRPASIPPDWIKPAARPQKVGVPDNPSSEDRWPPSTWGETDTSCFLVATVDLFSVQAQILSDLYGQNMELTADILPLQMLEATIRLDQKLLKWKLNIPEQLQCTPRTASSETPKTDAVFHRLSVILLLRYLNTRILLHRPMLSALLQRLDHPQPLADDEDDEDDYMQLFESGARSIRICEQSAMEIVDLVHRTSQIPLRSAAWWVSAHYIFNASLVIFGCLILHLNVSISWHKSHRPRSPDEIAEMVGKIRLAKETLKMFRHGTESGDGVQNAMTHLLRICVTLAWTDSAHGMAVLSMLPGHNNTEVSVGASTSGQSGRPQPQGGLYTPEMGYRAQTIPTDNEISESDIQDLFVQNDFDLVGALGGVYPSIASMMTM